MLEVLKKAIRESADNATVMELAMGDVEDSDSDDIEDMFLGEDDDDDLDTELSTVIDSLPESADATFEDGVTNPDIEDLIENWVPESNWI